MFWSLIRNDSKKYIKNRLEPIYISVFFVIIVSYYALLGQDAVLASQNISLIILWVNVLIAFQLAIPSLFQADYESGFIEQWLCMPMALEGVVFIRLLIYWLSMTIPLLLLAVVGAVMLSIPLEMLPTLLTSMACATIGLVSIGAVGAAMVLQQGARAAILLLLIVPFAIPVLLLGASLTLVSAQATSVWPIMIGLNMLLVPLGVFVSSYLIRHSQ